MTRKRTNKGPAKGKGKGKPRSSKGKGPAKGPSVAVKPADVIPVEPSGADVTLQTLATFARACFKKDTRTDGRDFWLNKDGTPEWVKALVMDAHASMLPDDWRYRFVVEALGALEDHDDADEACDSLEPDVYNSELHHWLASHLERAGYVDEAIKEMGSHHENGIDGDIAIGQLHEMREVFSSVRASLESRLSDIHDDAADASQ